MVSDTTDATTIQLAERTMMKVVYLQDRNDIEGIEIIKLINGRDKQRLKFSKFNLQQLRAFLSFIEGVDLGEITDRRIKLAEDSDVPLDNDTKAEIATFLAGQGGSEVLLELLENGTITDRDIVNTGYRKQQLRTFHRLLYEEGYLQTYKADVLEKPNTKDETAWQLFFERNQWIFGYGLDYRFQQILQREFAASETTAAGKEEVRADYLLGDNQFTTFVELKKPNTPLFAKDKNRSNSWCLSNDLTYAVSQILEQKASGEIKIETTKGLVDDQYRLITQNAYDSKVLLIIGCWDQVNKSSDPEGIKAIKRKTFELRRRDSRNIDIITYDELFERAKYIVESNDYLNNKAA